MDTIGAMELFVSAHLYTKPLKKNLRMHAVDARLQI